MNNQQESNYRWFIVSLSCLTVVFSITAPLICMPVFFKKISIELDLSLVQLGTVWGMYGLAGMCTTLFGGMIGDKFGTRFTLSVACIIAGLTGALRGFSAGFITLAATMLLFGFLARTITISAHKIAGVWFSGRQVVTANGIVATGFGLGFMLSAMLSDTVLSPLLGGWRNVVFFYGAISILIGFTWVFTRQEPSKSKNSDKDTVPFKQSLSHVFKIKEVWLLAFTQLCFTGCVVGLVGYLPLYLRNLGWVTSHADGALALLNAAGTIAALPLSILSGKLNSRKGVLLPIMITTIICVFLLTFTKGLMVWPLVILVGLVRDGYYSIIATMAMETEGIGGTYAGTATGLIWTFGSIGTFIAPPLGNSLASIYPGLPFSFWGAIVLVPLFLLPLIKETGNNGN